MTFYADLHIHSRFSRATSRECTPEQLSLWARRKGIAVLGTGDFTHPEWIAELKDKLVPSEPGTYRLRPDLEREVAGRATGDPTQFILQAEISTIYKKGDRTRKVHHVVFAPDFERADRIITDLDRIGNLASDGRPILGLDSRHLLEIVLEAGGGSFLVPAHIWTPWFSVLGSKSGFDRIEDCYDELTEHIFAVETGLSSDPEMNWRLSSLDRFRLVSNSDAHSPPKLGREACVFDTERDFFAMRQALESGNGYLGTVEFFPEEGKYHLDGHRKCDTRLTPEETRKLGGKCPHCGKQVTVGVMSRVEALADRPEGTRPEGAAGYRSFVPLAEMLGEILGVGASTKKVKAAYDAIIARLGPELTVLEHVPLDDIRRACSPLFAEAVSRMRKGQVIREAGYDGEYGVIRIFDPKELKSSVHSGLLFSLPPAEPPRGPPEQACEPTPGTGGTASEDVPAPVDPAPVDDPAAAPGHAELFGVLGHLDERQRAAAQIVSGPLMIIAGPGTGKTRTLTHRIAHLILEHGVPPENCLAITFTRRAAREMAERLSALLPGHVDRTAVMTFHALGYALLQRYGDRIGLDACQIAGNDDRCNMLAAVLAVSPAKARVALERISKAKRCGAVPSEEDARLLQTYEIHMQALGLVDFDDLVRLPIRLLESAPDILDTLRGQYQWVSVDEYQDIDPLQYRLLRQLVPRDGNLCVIGDPDQSIYGFRGADVSIFARFTEDFPGAETVRLTKNYRSGKTIVDAAQQVIEPESLVPGRALESVRPAPQMINIHSAATDKAEAEFVVHTIERLIGGSTFFSMDSDRVSTGDGQEFSFADFAVLFRTDAQSADLAEAFARSGMPFQHNTHLQLADVPAVQSVCAELRTQDAVSLGDALTRAIEVVRAKAPGTELGPALPALLRIADRSLSVDEFLSALALGVDVDTWDPRADRISLLTLRASKGLEFPVVFIVGCEDGVLPLTFGNSREGDTAEERRLFFVGMTRAQDRLFLCHARKRRWRGKARKMKPSPYLLEIEEALLEHSSTQKRASSRKTGEQLELI